ncbi:acyloxyacyl hydrolase [Lentiprolixibacter aurantiacus]|uniref:Acyloxyacyl hydrolase n=1 Tax=Lentiprolixibacter aurantiacus TaxID=2993939 RepID=A0AAE3MKI8_9FLAO|nr:acyloxyacyl hydrolase [Lentiprolixibacter aurantiacus]MCX2719133.1 acyloxyacyl hydrolase [Lentiprolixibacter aurantiacus]
MYKLVCYGILFCSVLGWAQQQKASPVYTLEINPFYGSILRHNTDVSHLIREHPTGFILGFSQKTFGNREWEQEYGFPDTGFSFIYQDMKTTTLGENFGLYGHYNFYFLRRTLQFRIGQGIAYNTNPYDKNLNFRGNAYGSHLMSSTYLMLNYYREDIIQNLGFRAGISLVHYSNANVKAPNTSTNTFALNAGLIYRIGEPQSFIIREKADKENFKEPWHYNLVFRSGINESDVINSGQFPFYILSVYADKRLNRKSGLQFGTEVFFSNFLKELIRFQALAFPEFDVQEDDDYKRVGLFVGHELYVNKISVVTQLGYYIYYPFDFEGRVYSRIGIKRYFGSKWFGAITLKSHAAKAEAIEFGIGIRL